MVIAECANHELGKYFIQPSGALLFLLTYPVLPDQIIPDPHVIVSGILYQTFIKLLPNTTKAKDEFCDYISKKISVFLENNKPESTSPSLLWGTLKAVIRGDIISYSTHLARS